MRWELLEDEHFSGTVRNELTEPDEGVSVESQSIEDLHGIRLMCVAWEEQDSGHQSSCCGVLRCAVVVVDFRRIRWLNSIESYAYTRATSKNPDQ